MKPSTLFARARRAVGRWFRRVAAWVDVPAVAAPLPPLEVEMASPDDAEPQPFTPQPGPAVLAAQEALLRMHLHRALHRFSPTEAPAQA